ncbi:MAG: F0F1 ATP synthase subunit A [Negativicutes bacterium]|nr:F0F1 ATP synthase subunit A [Negativicutes bacterium]
MNITPDATIYWQYGFIKINTTLIMTWVTMLILAICSWLITRGLGTNYNLARWRNLLEILVIFVLKQIEEVGLKKPEKYLSLLATLFLFLASSAFLSVVPGYVPATASLSTTAALAACVFFAVHFYGISERGLLGYLKRYIQPNILMLPFNIITDLSRTLALAVRLFGNMSSGTMIIGIILLVAPLVFPVALQLLGLLTGFVQSYIFTVLAMVYIAAGVSGKDA